MGRNRASGHGNKVRGRGNYKPSFSNHSHKNFTPTSTSLTITRRFDSDQSFLHSKNSFINVDPIENKTVPKSMPVLLPDNPIADESWQDDFGLETEVHLGLPGDYSGEEDAVLENSIDKSIHRNVTSGCGDVTDKSVKQPSLKNRLGPSTLQNRLGPAKNLLSRLGSVKNDETTRDCEYEDIDAFVVLTPDDNMNEFNLEETVVSTKNDNDRIDSSIPLVEESKRNTSDSEVHIHKLSKNDLRISLNSSTKFDALPKKQFMKKKMVKNFAYGNRKAKIDYINHNAVGIHRIGPSLQQPSFAIQSKKSLLPSPCETNADLDKRNRRFQLNNNFKAFQSDSLVGPRLSLLGNYSESAITCANKSVSGQTINVDFHKRRHLLESTPLVNENRALLPTSGSFKTNARVTENHALVPNSLGKRTLLTNAVAKRTLLPNTNIKRTLLPTSNLKQEFSQDSVPKHTILPAYQKPVFLTNAVEKRTLLPNTSEKRTLLPNSKKRTLIQNTCEQQTFPLKKPLLPNASSSDEKHSIKNTDKKRTLIENSDEQCSSLHINSEKHASFQNVCDKQSSVSTYKNFAVKSSPLTNEDRSFVSKLSKKQTRLSNNLQTTIDANDLLCAMEKKKINSDLPGSDVADVGEIASFMKRKSPAQEPSRAVADILQQLVKPTFLVDETNVVSDKVARNIEVFSRFDLQRFSQSTVIEKTNEKPVELVDESKRSKGNIQQFSEIEKEMIRYASETQNDHLNNTTLSTANRTLLPTPAPVRLPDPHTLQSNVFSSGKSHNKNASNTASVNYVLDSHQISNTNKTIKSFCSSKQQNVMLPNPNHLLAMHRKEHDNVSNLQQPEATIKEEIVNCFKVKKYVEGLEKLQDASNNYPDEFGDSVMCEVIEFCYKQGAVSTAVLAAQFVREPDQKLLAFFSKVAELHKSELRQYSDQLWIIFYRGLTHNPSPKAMMSFIKCFSTLRCWNKVWTAVETFARKDVIPIDGLCLCLHSLANGNGLEYLLTGVNILKSMSAQNAEKVGLDCIDRLWLQCALKGLNECVEHLDSVREFLHPSVIAEERFAGQTRAKIMEMVMGVRLDDLCVFIYALRSHVNKEAVRDFMVEAFSVAEGYIEKLENFLHVMTEKSHSEHVKSVDQCLAYVCLQLVQRATERQRWDEVVGLIQVIQNCSVNLEEIHASQVAESYLLAMLRTGKLSAAAALLEDADSNGLRLSDSTPERLLVRTPLLKQLYDTATSARDTTRVHLREACTALAGLLRVKEKDVGQVVGLNDVELNRQYNELLKVCCLRGTLDGLRLGLNIIPAAHRSSLVINATVLRTLLLACFQHKQQADQLHFLDLGIQVGIYPSIKIVSGPKKIAFPTDLSTEEILVIISTLFRRMKTHLVELLSSTNSSPPDVLEECDVSICALSVGERDRNFIISRQLLSTETGLLARIREVLSTVGNFYCQVQVEQITMPGSISALRLNANAVYQCVYYMEEV